jgi:hypothetical protein
MGASRHPHACRDDLRELEAGANIDDILAWYDGLDRDRGPGLARVNPDGKRTSLGVSMPMSMTILNRPSACRFQIDA